MVSALCSKPALAGITLLIPTASLRPCSSPIHSELKVSGLKEKGGGPRAFSPEKVLNESLEDKASVSLSTFYISTILKMLRKQLTCCIFVTSADRAKNNSQRTYPKGGDGSAAADLPIPAGWITSIENWTWRGLQKISFACRNILDMMMENMKQNNAGHSKWHPHRAVSLQCTLNGLKEVNKATIFITEQSFLLNFWMSSFSSGHDFIPDNMFPKLLKCDTVLLHQMWHLLFSWALAYIVGFEIMGWSKQQFRLNWMVNVCCNLWFELE